MKKKADPDQEDRWNSEFASWKFQTTFQKMAGRWRSDADAQRRNKAKIDKKLLRMGHSVIGG